MQTKQNSDEKSLVSSDKMEPVVRGFIFCPTDRTEGLCSTKHCVYCPSMQQTSPRWFRRFSSLRRWFVPAICGFSVWSLAGFLGCEPPMEEPKEGALALHVLPGSENDAESEFFALPFPNDVRLAKKPPMGVPVGAAELASGYDLTNLPKPVGQPGKYVAFLHEKIQGAGTGAAVFFRFDAPLDETTLPSIEQSTQKESTAFVVNVSAGSKRYGQLAPVIAAFHREGNRYIGDNWLSLRPLPGFPLDEKTTYAAIVTRKMKAQTGGDVRPDKDLLAMLSDTPPTQDAKKTAWSLYAPLRGWLANTGMGEEVAAATVFTTQEVTAPVFRLRQAVYAQAPIPMVQDFTYLRSQDGLADLYAGTFSSPNFQLGTPPYWSIGGGMDWDGAGVPKIVRQETLRFALSVPNAEMPADGWPVILYAHGTGGDYQTFVREQLGLRAALVEQKGQPPMRFAMFGIDQVLHGPRDPSRNDPEITFFNLQNLLAAKENVKQGAADNFQLLRLAEEMNVPSAPKTGRPIRFDRKRIYFMGHSQGGLTGPLFVAAEPKVRAAVFSGAGSVLILSLLNKTEPINIAELVGGLLQETPFPDHPLLNLLQAYFESSDPNNYGKLYFREPPTGMAPKSIFQTLGLWDHFTPVPNIAAFALAMGVQPVEPKLYDLPHFSSSGLSWAKGQVSGNVAGGKATAALKQYVAPPKEDGHFVIFDLWAARHDWSRFLATDARTGLPSL